MLGKGASGTAVMEHVRGQNGRRESGRQVIVILVWGKVMGRVGWE